MARKLSAAGAAAAVILLLAGAAAGQRQDDGQGAGDYETLLSSGNAQGMPMPDMSGIQQRMQAQMMQQMTQQMQGTVQQPIPAAAGQGAESMAVPDTMMRQNMQQQMQKVLGMNQPAEEQSGGLQIDSALAALKMDPSVQATINEKMMKIMEQTIRETFADPKMRQEMQQRLLNNGITPGTGQVKQP